VSAKTKGSRKNVLAFDHLGKIANSLMQAHDSTGAVVIIFKKNGHIKTGVKCVDEDDLRLALNWVIHDSFHMEDIYEGE
jgi:hypothetical protein